MKTVKDVMTEGVISVKESTPIIEVARIMSEHNISGVVVVDKDNSACGTLSNTDIVKAIARGEKLDSLKAEDIMTPCVLTADPDMDILEVAEIMQAEGVSRLFVCSEERVKPSMLGKKYRQIPVGTISASDIIRELAATRVH
jgi:predicted transcriptional regulator